MEELIRFVTLARGGQFTITDLCEQFGISRKTGYKHLGSQKGAARKGQALWFVVLTCYPTVTGRQKGSGCNLLNSGFPTPWFLLRSCRANSASNSPVPAIM